MAKSPEEKPLTAKQRALRSKLMVLLTQHKLPAILRELAEIHLEDIGEGGDDEGNMETVVVLRAMAKALE